ncbi:MAG: DNA topoisomerase 3 [Muribaculaceae bacterium]|nr:DNA topoisomerase 3 [Muribaculaceae bacterium]
MILCITEKPSVGADIAKIVGAGIRHDGYYEGNGYYVTWTFGHLCTLKEPADYTPLWSSWSLAYLPMIPPRFGIKLIPQKSIEKQFRVIETLINKASEIINCGDAGQEGELIQRWVMQKAGCRIPVKRLWISSLTDEAIREGFRNLKPEKDLQPLYEAGLCRAIGDWILGINATRLYTLKYRGRNGGLLSVGRVQTPTLALIVKRQQEIENFVPKDTWELKTEYRDYLFSSSLKPFDIPEKADKIIEEIKPLPLEITDVNKKKGAEAPPRLFDLTSLQVEANKKFGYSADDTLKTIQSLYEKKVATYPRVDTTYLTDDIYPKCGNILLGLAQYMHLIEPLKGRRLKKSKKVFDNSKVTDHHAIIPTGQPLPSNLSEREKNVFDLIAKRFIAVFYPDCSFEQTTATAKVGKYNFKATGKVILDQGWKVIFAKDAAEAKAADAEGKGSEGKEDKDEEKAMPAFVKGESGPHTPKKVKRTSQPPKYYTEGTLLKAMETAGSQVEDEDLREALKANGIGRPSTRAAIIEILYKREYIKKVRKSIHATQAGIDLIGIIKDDLLKSAELTGIWENRLRRIERQEYSASEFITQLKEMITSITRTVLSDNSYVKI